MWCKYSNFVASCKFHKHADTKNKTHARFFFEVLKFWSFFFFVFAWMQRKGTAIGADISHFPFIRTKHESLIFHFACCRLLIISFGSIYHNCNFLAYNSIFRSKQSNSQSWNFDKVQSEFHFYFYFFTSLVFFVHLQNVKNSCRLH